MRPVARILLGLAAAAAIAGCSKDSAKPAAGTSAGSQAVAGSANGEEPHRNGGPGPLAGRRGDRPDRDHGPGDDLGGPGGGWADRRAQFDTDGDGQLSDDERAAMKASMQAEREQRRQDMIAKFDKDGDGQLSDDEKLAMKTERAQGMVTHLDSDGDGKVSQAELDAAGGGRHGPPIDFAAADTDHDGALSAAELAAAMPDRHRGDHGGDDKNAPPAP